MGLFDWISGSKPAQAGAVRQPVATLREALLDLNRDTAPFVVRDGGPEGVDLVAEWKIVDARWYEIFAKAGLTRVFKVLMKFDEANGEVRSMDQEWTVEWRAGTPSLSLGSGSASGLGNTRQRRVGAFSGRKSRERQRPGVLSASVNFGSFSGQKTEVSFGNAYAFKEDLPEWGKVYEYRFATKEIKDSLIEATQSNGWGWKGVTFGKL